MTCIFALYLAPLLSWIALLALVSTLLRNTIFYWTLESQSYGQWQAALSWLDIWVSPQ
jgi:hypothetical protein